MATAERGEVWLADLGLAAKTRPVLVLNTAYSDRDYALLAVIPHTTTPRGSVFEVSLAVSGLRRGAFSVQGLLAIPPVRLVRKITELRPDQLAAVDEAVRKWLGLGE